MFPTRQHAGDNGRATGGNEAEIPAAAAPDFKKLSEASQKQNKINENISNSRK